MLDVVAQSAAERGMANIRTEQGKAESLPFADGEFDFVFSRYSTHHWRDVGLALREVRRVLKPGGVAIFVDVAAPGQALPDTSCRPSSCSATPAMCATTRRPSGRA